MSEQEKFQPSYDCTVFIDCSMDSFNVYGLQPGPSSSSSTGNRELDSNQHHKNGSDLSLLKASSSSTIAIKSAPKPAPTPMSTTSSASSPISEKNGNSKPYAFNLFNDIIDNSIDLNFSNFSMATVSNTISSVPSVLTTTASAEITQKWLRENRFDSYTNTFANFSGSDILYLSKDDLIQICGLTDGIRLYNALHSKSIKSKLSIYVCTPNEDLFRAIYLDTLTVNELQTKIVSNLLTKTKCTYLKRLTINGPGGVKVLMTDDVVRNLADESLYTVDYTKGIID